MYQTPIQISHSFYAYKMDSETEINFHGRWHSHRDNSFEFHYYTEGFGLFHNVEDCFSIKPGTFFITHPEERHSIQRTHKDMPFTFFAILFSLASETSSIQDLLFHKLNTRRNFEIGTQYAAVFETICKNFNSGQDLLRASASHLLSSFIFELSEKVQPQNNLNREDKHIQKILNFMNERVYEKLTLEQMAEHLDINKSHFIRIFKKRMGISPMKHFMKLRIETAAGLLLNTQMPVYEISKCLQFSNEFHFNKQFKQHKNVSPGKFRKL